MSPHQSVVTDDDHRVIKFRPRSSATLRDDETAAPVEAQEPDDFRHRMLTNAAAFAFTIALTAFGIWLAVRIADLRSTQDCVLMGRRDCARLSAPAPAALLAEPATRRH